MAQKYDKMIEYLLQANDFVKIEKVCADCSISERTFYNYLNNLKYDSDYIVNTKNKAIQITQKNKSTKRIPQTFEERKRWIYRKGLILQRDLSINNVIDYFGISEATLHAEIIKIRKEINKYHVRLITKKGMLSFIGNYHDLKRLTQDVIYEENNDKNSLLSTDALAELFPNIDVYYIKSCITEEFQKTNYFVDEYSVINLFIHILISANQELNGIVPINSSSNYPTDPIIEKICTAIEKKYDFKFSNSAKNQFSLLLETRARTDEDDIESSTVKNPKTLPIVNEILYKLLTNFNVDINEPVFKKSFALHIDSLLSRLENNVRLNNPLFGIIKQNSPITYDLAVFASKIITNYTNIPVSESEIAYLAIHIGIKIEELQSARTRLKAIIVCPEYYMYNSGLKKIVDMYKEDVYVTNVYTSFDDIKSTEDVDIVICSILPSNYIENLKYLKISMFLNNADRKLISDAVNSLKEEKRTKRLRTSISALFKKELFFTDTNFFDRDEAIDYLSDKLIKEGYVSQDYKQAVLARENIAPTDFNMIAVPHPAEFSAKQTVIGVAILNKPLMWSRSQVSIVFMIGIQNKDFEIFEDVFSSIIKIADDNNKVKALQNCLDYESFINKLIETLDLQ